MRMLHRRLLHSMLLGMLVAACAGEAPRKKDAGSTRDLFPNPQNYPDLAPPRDQAVWPDRNVPRDSWPWPQDSYAGKPFGCEVDTDCFGLKCCATPWGIKLCAAQCAPEAPPAETPPPAPTPADSPQ